ncbi:MAG: hypothetical protein Q4F65_11975 [Propionibacteriaceae bacterium]|nr:hypothetical protein [Propionibacteriaceae bacterium]
MTTTAHPVTSTTHPCCRGIGRHDRGCTIPPPLDPLTRQEVVAAILASTTEVVHRGDLYEVTDVRVIEDSLGVAHAVDLEISDHTRGPAIHARVLFSAEVAR